VAQLYPQAPGSVFVAYYGSQGYGGGILARLHAGNNNTYAYNLIEKPKGKRPLEKPRRWWKDVKIDVK
jgi:hypothetical protein